MDMFNELIDKITNKVSAKRQRNLLILIILLLFVSFGVLLNRHINIKNKLTISEQNNKALTDSIRVTSNKVGDLVFSKNIFVSKTEELKKLNSDLFLELKKERGKVREIVKLVSEIKSDTIYLPNTIVEYVGGNKGLVWNYDTIFSLGNERHISGVCKFNIDTNGLVKPLFTEIHRDEIKFNLITGIKENGDNVEIFVRSNYPNFNVTDLSGSIIDPKNHPVIKKFVKPKKWHIGPFVGVGLGVNAWPSSNVGLGFQVGFGLSYSLFSF